MAVWLQALLAVSALGFTLISFWWMNWRSGSLQAGDIQYFAAGKATEGIGSPNIDCVTLPLILYNTGARPVIVESLRLMAAGAGGLSDLSYEAVDSSLVGNVHTGAIERNHFFLPVYLKANDVLKENFVFQRRGSTFRFELVLYHLHLEAKISGFRDWFKIKDVELDFRERKIVPELALNIGYQVYSYNSRSRPNP